MEQESIDLQNAFNNEYDYDKVMEQSDNEIYDIAAELIKLLSGSK